MRSCRLACPLACPLIWLLAAAVLTSGLSRQLAEDTDENGNLLKYVATGESLIQALKLGVRHVVITEHLDLSSFSKELATLTRGVAATTQTATIQVIICTRSRAF
jgi:hypothetical protein